MPLYEYACKRCDHVTTYMEKLHESRRLARRWFGPKCKGCGSRKTYRVLSTFTASAPRSQVEVLNDLKSMGQVTFTNRPASSAPAMDAGSLDGGGACPSCGHEPAAD